MQTQIPGMEQGKLFPGFLTWEFHRELPVVFRAWNTTVTNVLTLNIADQGELKKYSAFQDQSSKEVLCIEVLD